ncbi:hypothetical protein QBC43DRAFT_360228 [Cladorrhinum sp. PSN259]|nr:hypothetical protein QBC43DRAFT_360228 [Cladorrhinum sp. PSN259]
MQRQTRKKSRPCKESRPCTRSYAQPESFPSGTLQCMPVEILDIIFDFVLCHQVVDGSDSFRLVRRLEVSSEEKRVQLLLVTLRRVSRTFGQYATEAFCSRGDFTISLSWDTTCHHMNLMTRIKNRLHRELVQKTRGTIRLEVDSFQDLMFMLSSMSKSRNGPIQARGLEVQLCLDDECPVSYRYFDEKAPVALGFTDDRDDVWIIDHEENMVGIRDRRYTVHVPNEMKGCQKKLVFVNTIRARLDSLIAAEPQSCLSRLRRNGQPVSFYAKRRVFLCRLNNFLGGLLAQENLSTPWVEMFNTPKQKPICILGLSTVDVRTAGMLISTCKRQKNIGGIGEKLPLMPMSS